MLSGRKSLQFIIALLTVDLCQVDCQQKALDVTRGEQDLFTNPKCQSDDEKDNCSDCKGLYAVCADEKCEYCRCIGHDRTFVSTRGQFGECVENEYLLYVTSFNSSFLVQETRSNLCLYQYKPKNQSHTFTWVSNSCNPNALSQRWVWNQNGQLINMDTLECLSEGWDYIHYHFLLMERCNANKEKQLWRCVGQKFSQQNSNRYMNYGNYHYYITTYPNIGQCSDWKRFGSEQPLCSEVLECQKFTDGSRLIILDRNKCKENATCIGQKEIAFDRKTGGCSIIPGLTQYWHKDVWKPLPMEEISGAFKTFTSKDNKTFLTWDLNKASDSWRGILAKLQFKCKPVDNNEETRGDCVLVKLKGKFSGLGCQVHSDGSPLIILERDKCKQNATCIGQKEIVLGRKTGECSMIPELTQYWHEGIWKPMKEINNAFKVFTREENTFVTWDLNKASDSWREIIVKLHFRCKPVDKDEGARRHCILIKLKGKFSALECQKFNDGFPLIILDRNKCMENATCIGQKEIALDRKTDECSIVPELTQYWHKDVWRPLPMEQRSNAFDVSTSENNKTFLMWDLYKTSDSWRGITVKLQFRCKPVDKDDSTREHCILIKLKGNFSDFQTPTQTKKVNDNNSETIIITLCMILAVTVITGVIIFVWYKRRKRLSRNNPKSRASKPGYKQSSSLKENSAETMNPLYSGSSTSRRECELYESSPDHVYQYIDRDHSKPIMQSPENSTYVHATNDGTVNTLGQRPDGDIDDERDVKENHVVSHNTSEAKNNEKVQTPQNSEKESAREETGEEHDSKGKAETSPKYYVLETD